MKVARFSSAGEDPRYGIVDDEEIERDIRQIINNPRYVTAQRKAEEVEKYVRENLLGNGTSITAPCSQRYDAAIAALNIAADALGITSGALGAASQGEPR